MYDCDNNFRNKTIEISNDRVGLIQKGLMHFFVELIQITSSKYKKDEIKFTMSFVGLILLFGTYFLLKYVINKFKEISS